jgi:hypothetical protein
MGVPVVLTGESPNVTIMTFNVKWLVDSEQLNNCLKFVGETEKQYTYDDKGSTTTWARY